MLGKTHMVIGTATALAMTQPHDMKSLVLCLGGSALGALISDIDVGTSESHRDADVIVFLSFATIVAMGVVNFVFRLGLFEQLMRNNSAARIIGGMIGFVIICAFGKEQPHRSFMHSFCALILLSICVCLIFPDILYYFILGFLSHLAIDIFNRRGVQLLYPLPMGFSLGLFHAHGLANTIFFYLGSTITVAEIILALRRIIF